MKILAFSDWRVQSSNMINSIIQDNNPDCILYAGDDLDRVIPCEEKLYLKTKNNFVNLNEEVIGDKRLFVVNEKNQTRLLALIKKIPKRGSVITKAIQFYYVNGNDDTILKKDGKYFIKVSPLNFQIDFRDIFITETPTKKITTTDKQPGLNKSTFNSFEIEEDSSEVSYNTVINQSGSNGVYKQLKLMPSFGLQEISKNFSFFGFKCNQGRFTEIMNAPKKKSEIFLTHIPPKGILDLSSRFGTMHIGSEKLLLLIKKFKPKFVICGHSHFWGGKSLKIDDTIVINISSHDYWGAPGNYALINTETDDYEIKTSEFKNLRQLRGAYFKSEVNFKIYGAGGVTHDHNLLNGDNEKIIKNLEINGKKIIAERIRSIGWDKPKVIKPLSFNPEKFPMVDIETGLYEATENPFGEKKIKMWLVGLLHKGKIEQFEYPAQKLEFIKFLNKNNITDLVSWTKFDSKILSNIRELRFIKWHDACQRTTFSVIWHSYKLLDLYKALINKTESDNIDGAVAGIYANHLIIKNKECKYCPPIVEIKAQIKEKNKKDLLQMFELCDYLWKYKT